MKWNENAEDATRSATTIQARLLPQRYGLLLFLFTRLLMTKINSSSNKTVIKMSLFTFTLTAD
ncbi:MAG: hypothetical protein ACKE5Q_07335 [Methylophilaceae bacterium]